MKKNLSGCFGDQFTKVSGLLLALIVFFSSTIQSQPCSPLSTLSCNALQVSLPYSLSFNSPLAGTLGDKNGAGTGFTLVLPYSGTRISQDGTPSNSSVPGYEPAKLLLSGGRLQLTTNKGIAYLTNNNGLNTLCVKVTSQAKLVLETVLVNPFKGTASEQAGLYFGLDDKTFLKLAVVNGKIEFRREVNDASSSASGTSNPDQRISATIASLSTKAVRLRLIIDPATQRAEGFYSLDNGASFLSTGTAYPTPSVSVQGMGLTANTAYAGIMASHRNSSTPVTYIFDEFSVVAPDQNPSLVFSPASYNFSLADNAALETTVGNVKASETGGNALTYTITAGNTNGTFAIDSTSGVIKLAKYLNYHTQDKYRMTVKVSDGNLSSEATVNINVILGNNVSGFNIISWGTVASQPYGTHEVHGVVVNGKLYSFGGYDVQKQPNWTPTKRAYVYDPVLNKWAPLADLPHTPNGSNFGGVTHVGVTTDGTDIYFVGGYPSNSSGTGQTFSTKQVWRYNVAANTYTALPNLPEALATGQLQYLTGQLHYFGGANSSRADVKVHYVLNLDSLSAGWKAMAPLNDGRNHAGSAVYKGKIYSLGGSHGQDHATVTQKTVEVYDEAANTWTRVADMPVGLDHIASSTFVLGDRIFVLGGESRHDVKSNRVLVYTPATNAWSELTPLPLGKSAGVAAALKGVIYYSGGNFSRATRTGSPGVQQVTSFTVMNADTDQPLFTLANGSTLNLDTLPTRNLNIRANLNTSSVGSVKFVLSGAESVNAIENISPYALFGDDNGNYKPWTPAAGSYVLEATPYTAANATGTAGTAFSVSFKVTTQLTTAIVAPESAEAKGLQLKAYPNPSAGEPVRVEVYNLRPGEEAGVFLFNIIEQMMESKKIKADAQGKGSTLLLATGKHTQPGTYLIQLQSLEGKKEARLMVK